ncbi:hypothetical protein IP88_01780 [alpha proteobacterium AAP81b]|nr:hypothetical protein IP88_01780 [alpha proteobacterium AAP81b]
MTADAGQFRRLWLARAIFVFAVSISAGFVWNEFLIAWRGGIIVPDLPVFWTAARHALASPEVLYDPARMTALQAPFLGPDPLPRPFAYPPTSLLLFGPFGMLPYRAAAIAWVLLSCGLFFAAARRLVPARHVVAAFFTPPLVACLLSLQVSLLLGAGMMFGVSLLDRRPGIAGAVIGLVALVKPPVVLLFPIAAIAMRSPRALGGFCLAGVVGCLASLFLGIELWFHWLASLGEFQRIVAQLGLMRRSVTPTGIGFYFGLSKDATAVLQVAGIILGGVTCWRAFRGDDAIIRLIGLAAGSLLCAPYAMYHELSVLVPALLMIGASQRRYAPLTALPVIGVFGMFTLPLTSILALVDRRTGPG